MLAIGRRVREAARGPGKRYIVAENEPQETHSFVRPRRRLRTGRAVERRFPPLGHRGADRPTEAYYTDYMDAAGVHLGGEMGLSLPGPALQVAEETAGHAGPRSAAGAVRQLHPEPRPGRQFRRGARGIRSPARASPGAHGSAACLGAGDAHAFSRPGVRRLDSVLSTLRITSRSWPSWWPKDGRSFSRNFANAVTSAESRALPGPTRI